MPSSSMMESTYVEEHPEPPFKETSPLDQQECPEGTGNEFTIDQDFEDLEISLGHKETTKEGKS